MITFFFVPSTIAMGAAQISIPPAYPNGTTQSNQTNATALERRRLDLGSLELEEGVYEEGRGGYLARSGGMGAGACVGDARGRMRQGLPSMPDRAIGGRGWRGRACPAGEGEHRDCHVEYPSGVVQGKGSRARGQPRMEVGAAGGPGRGCHGLVAAAMDGSFVGEIRGGFGRPARFAAMDASPAREERQKGRTVHQFRVWTPTLGT
jgi:hypothetical protein